MNPRTARAYSAALMADLRFQRALEAEYGADAGDARYGPLSGKCRVLGDLFKAAMKRWHTVTGEQV